VQTVGLGSQELMILSILLHLLAHKVHSVPQTLQEDCRELLLGLIVLENTCSLEERELDLTPLPMPYGILTPKQPIGLGLLEVLQQM